jgi:hypothetical protein
MLCAFIIISLIILFFGVTTLEGFGRGRHRRGGGRHHGGGGRHHGGGYGRIHRWQRGYRRPQRNFYWYNPWDMFGSCKKGCTSIGNGRWGCQYPGNGSNDCWFSTDCDGCGN